MIESTCCHAPMALHSRQKLKTTGEYKHIFRCTCCHRTRSAYSVDGEVWKWETRPAHRPAKVDLDYNFA